MLAPVLGADSSEQTKPTIIFFLSLSWVCSFFIIDVARTVCLTHSAYLKLEKMAGEQQEV